jgi:hypothetical protein
MTGLWGMTGLGHSRRFWHVRGMRGLPPIATVKLTSRCSVSGTAEATTNLKPFEPVAHQGVVEATAKKLLLPGAMVLLRTPQDDFAFGCGATELGGTTSPRADTHFRGRLEHQDDDGRGDRAAGPGRKIAFRRSGLKIC